jgi:thiol-disulfide isomerase/thioredoxin
VLLGDLLRAGRPALLIFAGSDCWGCKVLLPVVRRWQREYADRLTIAVISGATREETAAKMAAYEIDHLLLDEDLQVADSYQARWTPAAVLVNAEGRISSHVSYGDNAIREWLRNQIASGALPSNQESGVTSHLPQVTTRYSVREIGEAAPRFSLLDLAGERVRMEDLLGGPTILFFWHPHCAYCAAMKDDLQSWEDQPTSDRPKLVFVAAGELDDIRAINRHFKSPTLMDPAFDIAPLFGTKFTPSAILIDSEGRVVSSLAIGEGNVRALIGLPKPAMSIVAVR